ncbi:MAG: hypothetical protein LBO00_01275 [Zoogloeaceae bacterium]|jgi:hypothetical protein|nr:hypothetical protein [Zoogloeaceae bacterium]
MKINANFMFFADRNPRINISLRVLMAIFGSYGLALLGAAALAAGTLVAKPDAVNLAIMLSFLLYLLSVIWVFATATLLKAALGLLVPAAFFGLWLALATPGGTS